VNDAALLLGLGAGIGEEKALAADDRSLDREEAAVFAGVDRVDLFVERLLIQSRAVDEDGDNVRMAQAVAVVRMGRRIGSILRWSGAFARPFLLGLF